MMRQIRVLFLVLALLSAGLPVGTQAARAGSWVVNNTSDSGAGSLRQALIDANNSTGPDAIEFNIPKSDPGYSSSDGVWTIEPATLLPSLTGGDIIIDGATQTTNQGDTNIVGPEVRIDGWKIGANGWVFSVESHANQILGLVISGADYAGIKIINNGSGNIIKDNYIGVNPDGWSPGGNGTGIYLFNGANGNVIAHNVISHNDRHGIIIAGSGTDQNMIRRNYIGLDYIGTGDAPNGIYGIVIMNGASANTVGGEAGYRNYIGGNREDGISISGANNNNVTHNYIGIDSTGTGFQDVGNVGSGVVLEGGSAGNWIAYNVLSGNGEHGILIDGSGTDFNHVEDNVIGADANVTKLLPNGKHGVAIYGGAQRNEIGTFALPGNVIVGNGWSGVTIVNTGTDFNQVVRNAIGTDLSGTATSLGNNYYGIHVNGGSGNEIRLNHIAYNGTNSNQAGVRIEGSTATGNTISQNSIHDNGGKGIELAAGGNGGILTPSITTVDCGKVEGTTGAGSTVEVFSDSADEGRSYEGTVAAHAIQPAFSWSGSATGPNVTVTATDSQGNTSEFSAPAKTTCHRALLPLILK